MTRISRRPVPRGATRPSASHLPVPDRTEPTDPSTGRKPHDAVSPRAGRTGGLGTRAERPSEGGKQPVETTHQDQHRGRGGKAPSAARDSHHH